MDVFQNDLQLLRCLTNRDCWGFCAADLLDLGALSGLVRFFEISHAPDEGYEGTAAEENEYLMLIVELRAAWDAEIVRDRELNKIKAGERRHAHALKTAAKRRANLEKRA
jgi:hypothetical protein